MKLQILIVVLIQCAAACAGLEYEGLIGKLHMYNFIKEPRSLITFVNDPIGNKYVIKQYRHERAGASFATLVSDLVALDVGHSLGISVNHACLLPAGLEFIGKDTHAPATLHIHVPGIDVKEYLKTHEQSVYAGLMLEQKFSPYGLTRDLIYHMSRNKDLPPMVALDTFVCNGGRLQHNYFYDEATDRFYGIDMASSFGRNLCWWSVNNMSKLLKDQNTKFSTAELKGLRKYYKTFKKLVKLHSPEYLCEQLDVYAYQAGLLSADFFDKQAQVVCREILVERKESIHASAVSAREFVDVLEALLVQHGVRL